VGTVPAWKAGFNLNFEPKGGLKGRPML